MLGAIIGDIVGSCYEFNSIKTTEFELFQSHSRYTDDSVMTMAVAEWLLEDPMHTHEVLEDKMVKYGNLNTDVGFGPHFLQWLFFPQTLFTDGKRKPYNSFGNGSAMRVSAVGWMFGSLEETERVAGISASITHNHSEGIKGAQATAAAIFMARNGASKEEIGDYISKKFEYDLNRTCDQIRPLYGFEVSCQKSVPESIVAFLDSTDYESTLRLAVSLGGDSDTQACIAGGIAEAFYGIPDDIIIEATSFIPQYFKDTIVRVAENSAYGRRMEQKRFSPE